MVENVKFGQNCDINMTVLTVQRLIEATGMTWTYMSDGWTGISDRPTTIAPLKAVLTRLTSVKVIR